MKGGILRYFNVFRSEKTGSLINKDATTSTDQAVCSIENLCKLRPDFTANQIKSLILDEAEYIALRPDVSKANVCPFDHFINYGYSEGTLVEPKIASQKSPPHDFKPNYDLIYIFSGPKDNASYLYRCVFKSLEDDRIDCISSEKSFGDILMALFTTKTVCFLRPDDNPRTIYLMCLCRNLGIEVVADYDDLLLPEYVGEKGAVRSKVIDRGAIRQRMELVSASLLWVDRITCSTEVLKSRLEHTRLPVTVVANKLPKSKFSELHKSLLKGTDNPLKILYASGSATHSRDFSIASGALLRFAQNYGDSIEVTFMGNTAKMLQSFKSYCRDTKQIPMVEFDAMLHHIKSHDILIVPLENSTFNDAKSNIKFIEAASQGVPVIASPAREFIHAIDHGVNGWICSSGKDWYETLVFINDNKSILRDVGLNAQAKALEEFSI